MIELNSVFVILFVEAFAVFTLLILGYLLFSKNNSSGEFSAADELISKLEESENIKAKKLGGLILKNNSVKEDELNKLLDEISQNERLLYQKIIKMFLTRDIEILQELDQYIDQLSAPYCKLLSGSTTDTAIPEKLKVAENKIRSLMEESKHAREQLKIAMTTMDEISAEYSRVFKGTQTEVELANSSKKMINIFHDAGNKIKDTFNNQEVRES